MNTATHIERPHHPYLPLERFAILDLLKQMGGWVERAELDAQCPFEAGCSQIALDGLEADRLVDFDGGMWRAR